MNTKIQNLKVVKVVDEDTIHVHLNANIEKVRSITLDNKLFKLLNKEELI